MNLNDFDYELPLELIAQTPLTPRDNSKLLVLDKENGAVKHDVFKNIGNELQKNDILVLNDTKVIPARLIGTKKETGAVIEILLLKELGNNDWECLARPVKRLKVGTLVEFSSELKAEVIAKEQEGIIRVRLIFNGILMEILDRLGQMPLPPYIHEKLIDKNRYQTIYAKNIGSAAAPTAGLHFTEALLKELEAKGVKILFVTLHVGLGTFRPVEVENILDHNMHSEYYEMTQEVACILNSAKKNGQKIYAVGTTTTRVLETVYNKYGEFKASQEDTNIFIYPGYKFKAIDGLITNFHLPKSTLLMLVSALASKEMIMNAYKEAIKKNYRFFSFGDAMFIK